MAKNSNKRKAYPDKRTMNLYYKPDRTTKPATISLYVLFALSLLLLLGKLFVYDVLVDLGNTIQELDVLEQHESSYAQQLSEYNEVLGRYNKYSLTADEANKTDRMEILDLIDDIIRPEAEISSISIAEGIVELEFSGLTLRKVEEISQSLEQSSLVFNLFTSNASTDDDKQKGIVSINMTIELRLESERMPESEDTMYEEKTDIP